MGDFTSQEYCDMLIVYGASQENVMEAVREYSRRFPNRRVPSRKAILSAVQRVRDTGSALPKRGGEGLLLRPRDIDQAVLEMVEDEGTVSTRDIARRLEISQNMAWRILKENVYHPYHYRKEHVLEPADFELRLRFCEWLLECNTQDNDFKKNILWTDESLFTREGVFNSHNSHVWAQENPHIFRDMRSQHRFSVNVWAGMFNNVLIGPYILPRRLTADVYLDFLRNTLFENLPLHTLRTMWFMHDGAPPHFGRQVRQFLDEELPQRWIGRGGYISWPPRSPDITPLDFFIWGYMKDLVYANPINTEQELLQNIENAAVTLRNSRDKFDRAQENLIRRLNLCCECNGGKFEHLL